MDIESQPAVAGDSIKSSTPAEMLGRGPRPGVKRSGTPGDCPKIMPARGAGDSGHHDFRAVACSAGCGPWMCCSWGSATLHPRLYAIARYRGLAWISSPNDFLCKAQLTLTLFNYVIVTRPSRLIYRHLFATSRLPPQFEQNAIPTKLLPCEERERYTTGIFLIRVKRHSAAKEPSAFFNRVPSAF